MKNTASSPVLVRDALLRARSVVYDVHGPLVLRTVAERIALAASNAVVDTLAAGDRCGVLRISIGTPVNHPGAWMYFQIDAAGSGTLSASHPHWLYALSTLATGDWLTCGIQEFEKGIRIEPAFPWLRNLSDFFVGSLRSARAFNKEEFVRQLVGQGFSHVTINGLGADRPFESGPPGDVYSWFYDYSPDLDQFIEGPLTRDYYPADYLQTNLNNLKRNALLARTYGLTPGLHINSPRSMPDEFWHRYGFLRGARVDHPRESFRPRYTLALAHPVVQAHYRELVKSIMAEVPELGFIHLWTNDSGAGFEFVSSLYAGRNGGPYLIREWKDDEEIARKAAANVVSYYRLITEEAKNINPGFHLICDLGPFNAERKFIAPELGNGIDAGEFAYFEQKETDREQKALARIGAMTHVKFEVSDNNVVGVPFPWLVYERLTDTLKLGTQAVLLGANPASLAPYDVNNEVVRHVQLRLKNSIEEIVEAVAERLVGTMYSRALINIWKLSDSAVRSFPAGVPMSSFGFPWFRLWVRPFVPDIDAIPETERAYYERFLLATFNNPARIDLNNDMLWNFLAVDEAAEKKSVFDNHVIPFVTTAIENCREQLSTISAGSREHRVFKDLLNRLGVYRCFCTTMRNTMAWTEGVHGYIDAETEVKRERYRGLTRSMVESEIENANALLTIWDEGGTEVIPISRSGETLHIYGENFGELLQKKIALMEQHKNDEPRIDPDYMWRMPSSF
ncbi:MAG: hypothetical protein HY961_05710, partial [Ignavibacteriae bacterium]|nr:hypothetical protein [Ignavibacteriota bacterium]